MSPTNLSSVPRCSNSTVDHPREVARSAGATTSSGVPFSDIAVKPRMSENSTVMCRRVPPSSAQRRVGHQLVVDVLRHVAREQLLDLALLAAFDEVLPREIADEGEASASTGTVMGIQVPRANSATDCHASSAASAARHRTGPPRVEKRAGNADNGAAAMTQRNGRPTPARARSSGRQETHRPRSRGPRVR